MRKLRTGDRVEVLSKEDILATLDENGRLNGLPFMPQMFQYCGQRFTVFQLPHTTCETIACNWDTPGRVFPGGIHPDRRCDGSAHGGCQAACLIFWHEAWLKPIDAKAESHASANPGVGCTSDDVG